MPIEFEPGKLYIGTEDGKMLLLGDGVPEVNIATDSVPDEVMHINGKEPCTICGEAKINAKALRKITHIPWYRWLWYSLRMRLALWQLRGKKED